MFPYLIAGAIGFVVAKLLEDDETPKYADGGLIAPNGKPSKLTPEQYKLVRTTAFKKWFGDWENDPANASKVVDSNGEPLVVYHGTDKKFNVFDLSKKKRDSGYKKDTEVGIYATSNKSEAFMYNSKYLLPLFANIKKPKEFKGIEFRNLDKIKFDGALNYERKYDYVNGKFVFKEYRLQNGRKIIEHIMANNSNQIKLADGSNTTFDSNNPDIRFEQGGMTYRQYADTQFNEEEDRYLPSDYFENLEIKKASKDNLPLIKIKDGLEYRKWENSFIKVFDNDYLIGFADTKSIQVAKQYQKRGIGLELVTILKEMNPNHRFGSMTPQGFNLMGKYYDTKIGNNPDIRFENGGLIAPNGKPSNLTPEQYKLVRTKAFKDWFGDWENDSENASKVVDENGEPLVCYHTTDYLGEIHIFNFSEEYDFQQYGFGVYFTDDKKHSESYFEGEKYKIYQVFLNLKNPIILNQKEKGSNKKSFLINREENNKAGAIIYHPDRRKWNYFIAGEPNQIKLADGTNTTFDSNNADISFDEGGKIEELKFSNKIESDAMGYDIGDYLYHITPVSNFNTIMKKGFIPKNGISINNKPFINRLYFATSLISAYDLSVNFGSYRDDREYVIFKIKSDCINDYEEDGLFAHGIYVDYKLSNKCIVGYVNANELFNKFDDEDIDNLYY